MMRIRFAAILLILIGIAVLPAAAYAQDVTENVTSGDVEVTSGGQAYQSDLAAPAEAGVYPGIVLIHSFNGLEEGYRTMVDQFAAEGFVVLAVGWQTFERQPSDDTVRQLVEDSVAFLSARDDVDPERLGLTGFCAGGRYTMLLLPQIDSFKAGVAWYGFPYNGDPAPASFVGDLSAPMLIIHGTADQPSPVADIYRYAGDLTAAGAEFELKVYSGEPHGFMVQDGQLNTSDIAQDAFSEMADFFGRKLV
ncbi:MAG: dienelactone hydrolase family protein [Anaerolineae bacterium]|nr:dienelactone hydrolase family protein [Anaerolineae bacterium]